MTITFANAAITSMAIVGAGAGGWPTGASGEVDSHQMTTTDQGIHWTITNLGLSSAAVKFRANNEWNPLANWGGTSFPTGTGTLDGAAITAVAGIYNVTFNTNDATYTFELQQLTFQTISIIGDASPIVWSDTDMYTVDGNIYTLRATLGTGALKFRGDHSWTLPYNWGGTNFPSGTAVVDASGVVIPTAGTYDIVFNKSTLAYSIKFKVVSIFGDATPLKWDSDTDMSSTDGTNYSITAALTTGALKFRGDHSWTLPYNWGGTAFPSGTAVIDASGIMVPTAGNYAINFNVSTAAYSISSVLATQGFSAKKWNAYPNPTQNFWDISASNETIKRIQIISISGRTLLSQMPNTSTAHIDASSLASGVYFAQISTATATKTIKIIKE